MQFVTGTVEMEKELAVMYLVTLVKPAHVNALLAALAILGVEQKTLDLFRNGETR
jgi:hypothetical protein